MSSIIPPVGVAMACGRTRAWKNITLQWIYECNRRNRRSNNTLSCYPVSSSISGSSNHIEVFRRKPWQPVLAPTPRLHPAMAGPLPKEALWKPVLTGELKPEGTRKGWGYVSSIFPGFHRVSQLICVRFGLVILRSVYWLKKLAPFSQPISETKK